MTTAAVDVAVRRRVRIRGVVQGVGFRPFVYRLAVGLGLGGLVGNDGEGVFVEVEGSADAIATFERRLVTDKPVLARIDEIGVSAVAPVGEQTFRIVESRAGAAVQTYVPPDIAVCDDCLRELFEPHDRRYRYPFINCTNCGPRFTITIRLPYDRPNTTMADFSLCDACAAEYHDPLDRRFHAQPVACAACGPRIWFDDGTDVVNGTDSAIAATQRALASGGIVAVKGLGGYHLACDARSPTTVALLRRRKSRPDKPLAVMVPDLAAARRLALIDDAEVARLVSPQRPIVLVPSSDDAGLAPSVAPDSPFVGVMLPYTPVHHLLFRPVAGADPSVPEVLVMTSGNLSEEPICYDDVDARQRLRTIADAWLVHDRPIHVPCDDSVVRVIDGEDLPIRRSRGYAPLTIRLPFATTPTLAVGGELKNAFCLARGTDAWMSQHIGDMGSIETIAAFERSTRQFADMYAVEATRLVADAHPGYHTRSWAEARAGEPVVLVQHHHAHIAAVMAEHGLPADATVIGFAFDGTGYGTDGAIWGGEVFLAGYGDCERVGHLRYVPLPGGDKSIRKPYRAALAHLWAVGIEWTPDLAPARVAPADELSVLRRQLERGVYCVPTSSMGRLFDAVSSLLGVRHVVSYEAQAAIEMEIAASAGVGAARDYRFAGAEDQIDPAPVLRGIVDDVRNGCPTDAIAAGFHVAVARLVADRAEHARDDTGIALVALSGGVFQNVLLVRLTRAHLIARGFDVLTHRLVPPNDGGLALGQVAIASYRRTGQGGCQGESWNS